MAIAFEQTISAGDTFGGRTAEGGRGFTAFPTSSPYSLAPTPLAVTRTLPGPQFGAPEPQRISARSCCGVCGGNTGTPQSLPGSGSSSGSGSGFVEDALSVVGIRRDKICWVCVAAWALIIYALTSRKQGRK